LKLHSHAWRFTRTNPFSCVFDTWKFFSIQFSTIMENDFARSRLRSNDANRAWGRSLKAEQCSPRFASWTRKRRLKDVAPIDLNLSRLCGRRDPWHLGIVCGRPRMYVFATPATGEPKTCTP